MDAGKEVSEEDDCGICIAEKTIFAELYSERDDNTTLAYGTKRMKK